MVGTYLPIGLLHDSNAVWASQSFQADCEPAIASTARFSITFANCTR